MQIHSELCRSSSLQGSMASVHSKYEAMMRYDEISGHIPEWERKRNDTSPNKKENRLTGKTKRGNSAFRF